jgi:hypothetical protein
MKNFKISVLFLFLTIFSLPVLADDALLSEIIRLDEERRAEVKTLHIEYDYTEQAGDGSKYRYEALGQVWEQLGNDKYRFRLRIREASAGDDLIIVMKDAAVDSSAMYELKVPYEAFPVKEPLELCKFTEYRMQRYSGRITKNPRDVWGKVTHPFLTLPISDADVSDSYKELFEKHPPTRVEKIQNDAGDEVVQVELSGEDGYLSADGVTMRTYRWTITIDFNLSKGGLLSKYFYVCTYDGPYPTLYVEGLVTRFGESPSGSGHWYPQEYQRDMYKDTSDRISSAYTITEFTLNKKSENQLGPVQFPEGIIVEENDESEEGKWVTHIWGENKSKKKFDDEDEFYEYLAKHCSLGPYALQAPLKSVSSIRIALLLLGALFIAAGLYMRRRRKVS